MYYSGIDLHSGNSYITTIDDNNALTISMIVSSAISTPCPALIKLSSNPPPAGTGSTIS